MNTEPTNCQSRYEQCQADERQRWLRNDPELLAETIASHYAKLASAAASCAQVIRNRRMLRMSSVGEMDSSAEFIAFIISKIEEQHVKDFGIPAAWTLLKQ